MCFFRLSGTKKNWLDLFPTLKPKKSLSFWMQMQEISFFVIFKKILLLGGFPPKTTLLTSILISETTDMVPQPQYELGKVPGTQSGTWENLVPQMCKSHQTTSVKVICIFCWKHFKLFHFFLFSSKFLFSFRLSFVYVFECCSQCY